MFPADFFFFWGGDVFLLTGKEQSPNERPQPFQNDASTTVPEWQVMLQ